jgi:hypothetical protein
MFNRSELKYDVNENREYDDNGMILSSPASMTNLTKFDEVDVGELADEDAKFEFDSNLCVSLPDPCDFGEEGGYSSDDDHVFVQLRKSDGNSIQSSDVVKGRTLPSECNCKRARIVTFTNVPDLSSSESENDDQDIQSEIPDQIKHDNWKANLEQAENIPKEDISRCVSMNESENDQNAGWTINVQSSAPITNVGEETPKNGLLESVEHSDAGSVVEILDDLDDYLNNSAHLDDISVDSSGNRISESHNNGVENDRVVGQSAQVDDYHNRESSLIEKDSDPIQSWEAVVDSTQNKAIEALSNAASALSNLKLRIDTNSPTIEYKTSKETTSTQASHAQARETKDGIETIETFESYAHSREEMEVCIRMESSDEDEVMHEASHAVDIGEFNLAIQTNLSNH